MIRHHKLYLFPGYPGAISWGPLTCQLLELVEWQLATDSAVVCKTLHSSQLARPETASLPHLVCTALMQYCIFPDCIEYIAQAVGKL